MADSDTDWQLFKKKKLASTRPLTVLESRESYVVQERRATDFQAPKLRKVPSGKQDGNGAKM